MLPQPPASTLFPYTTLFRSGRKAVVHPEAGLILVDAPPLANEVIPEGIAVRQIGERDRVQKVMAEGVEVTPRNDVQSLRIGWGGTAQILELGGPVRRIGVVNSDSLREKRREIPVA